MGMFTVAVIIGTQLLGLQTNTRIGSADPFCTHSVASTGHLTMHWYPTPISIGRPRTGRNRAAPNSQCAKKKRRCGNTTDKALKARSLPDPGTPHRPLACRMGRAPTSAPASSAFARSS